MKNVETKIVYQQDNPKNAGSKASERCEEHKAAQTVGGSKEYKSSWQDLTSDFENGYVKFSSDDMEVEPFAGIRAAQAGTLDRKASARSKVPHPEIVEQRVSKPNFGIDTFGTYRTW